MRLMRPTHLTAVLFATALGAAACQNSATPPAAESTAPPTATTEAPAATSHPLANTSWRLVELQSMDDSIGVVRPEDSSRFTMHLAADGSASFRLDCNRGTGTWTSEPGADRMSGTFTFGPIAMTRALCPPPNLDERIAREAEFVRSYLLRDGRLALSLMADGGIQIWEPDPDVRFLADPDPVLESAILDASPDYTPEMAALGPGPSRYVYNRVDLDDDSEPEVVVYLLGSFFCGSGGCTMLLLDDAASDYRLVQTFSIARAPVIVSSGATSGWHDLFKLESGGGAEASYVRYAFDGTEYVETDRRPVDQAPEGLRYLGGDPGFEDGAVLEPRVS